MRKVKMMSEVLSSPYEPATVSHSRYQSTLWSATVPQLCSCQPQARASQPAIQRIRLSRIFAGSSRIINENLSVLFSFTSFSGQRHISLANAIDDKAFYACRKSCTTNAFAKYISIYISWGSLMGYCSRYKYTKLCNS